MNAPIKPFHSIQSTVSSKRFSVQLSMDLNVTSHAEFLEQTEHSSGLAPSVKKSAKKFTFIDLFAGIGGFRLALTSLGGHCVFSSEWDAAAQKTYFANFGELPHGDITLESTKDVIPYGFDVLCAGG